MPLVKPWDEACSSLSDIGSAPAGANFASTWRAVHSINCPNVTNLLYEPERRIDVLWAGDKDGQPVSYPVKLTLLCDDRFGMLKQITAVISDTNTNIRNMESRSQNGRASIDVVLEIADLKHLQKIMDGVRQIPGVHDVQRLQKI